MSYWHRRVALLLVAAGALLTVGCSSSGSSASYVGYSVYSGYGYPYYGYGYGYRDYDHDDFDDARDRLKNRDRHYSGGNIGRPGTTPSSGAYGGGHATGAFRGAGGMQRAGGGFRGGGGGFGGGGGRGGGRR